MAKPLETLRFTTATKPRVVHPIPVTFCGESFTVERPKDSVLYFASTVTAGDVVGGDRAGAILQFLNSTLSPEDRHRFFARAIDRNDPVNLGATLELIEKLLLRWKERPEDGPALPVVVEATIAAPPGEQTRIVNDDLDLDFVAHPPKDVILLFVAASLSTGSNIGQQAWAISVFLDAALDPDDALIIATRMRDPDDDLDLSNIAEVVTQLVPRWDLGSNRASRRAAARSSG